MNGLTLDVGCGINPRGTVNCDMFIQKTPHRTDDSIIPAKQIPNFVKCNCEYLPFRSNSFFLVTAYDILEHLNKPIKALKEMIRVSNCKVIFEVPHKYHPHRIAEHRHTFTVKLIKKVLEKVKANNYKITVSWHPKRFYFLTIFQIPNKINVTILNCDKNENHHLSTMNE